MISAVAFDFGGVIVDLTSADFEAFIAKLLNLPMETVHQSLFAAGGDLIEGKISEDLFWRNYALAMGQQLPKNWEKTFQSFFEEKSKLNREVVAIVNSLKKKQLLVPLLSNISPLQLRIFKDLGYFRLFNPLIFSCEVGLKKPDRRIFDLLLEKIKLQPDECLLIDDEEQNVNAATSLGIRSIRFQSATLLANQISDFFKGGS